jgi:hypothetical protein
MRQRFSFQRNSRTRPTPLIILTAAIGIGVATVATVTAAHCASALHSSIPPHSAIVRSSVSRRSFYPQSRPRLVQNSDNDVDSEVPPDQVEKYIAVYKDMQRDRSLTVEKAAAKQGLSVAEFRALEQKIERDDPAREHVRTELQGAVEQSPNPPPPS